MYFLELLVLFAHDSILIQMKILPKVTRRQKLDSLSLCAQGVNQVDAATATGISLSTVKRAKRKQKRYGDVEGGRRKSGPKPKFTPDIINASSFIAALTLRSLFS